MTAERIAVLEAQLAAAQATIRDQARALEENARRERERDALRIEQERETERQRILRRERNARHRAARRQGDASETLVRRSGDVSETSHPSFSSPPLDGPPLPSQTQLSPPLYPLPASSSPSSGLADASPPVSDNSADDLPQADPEDVLEEAGGVESGPIPPLDSPIPHSASLPGQGANPSGSPNGSNHPAKPESSVPPWPPSLRLEVQLAPTAKRAPPARKAAREAKEQGGKPPDHRHATLVQVLTTAFEELIGKPYGFAGGRDARLVTDLLELADQNPAHRGLSAAADEVELRWRRGLRWRWGNGDTPVRSLADLKRHWNPLAEDPASKPRGNPNAPTAGATEWDWTGAATGREVSDA